MNTSTLLSSRSKLPIPYQAWALLFLSLLMSNCGTTHTPDPSTSFRTAFMHDDALSSDVFAGRAPSGNPSIRFETKGGAVPTILQGDDGFLQVICVRNEGAEGQLVPTPYLLLLDPETMGTHASLKLPSGTALNTIYGYLNEKDEFMLANGRSIFRISHLRTEGQWDLKIEETFTLGSVADDFQFVAITPDGKGNIWFASYASQAGFLDPRTGEFKIFSLSARTDEIVANSISSCPDGIAIATTHSLYVLDLKENEPAILWKADYDRGDRVKPGQLSWGTGSSPSFFGPESGYEYLTLLDNGTHGTHLNIYNSRTGERIAHVLAFEGDVDQGSENSPIAYKNSVIIASTYGFPYPASSSATDEVGELKNGMQRFEVLPNGSGARSVWFNKEVRSTSVPKLGKDSDRIYFINEDARGDQSYAAVDLGTGQLVSDARIQLDPYSALPNSAGMTAAQRDTLLSRIGNPFNAMQMAGLFDGKGTLYQGTKLGIMKFSSPGD